MKRTFLMIVAVMFTCAIAHAQDKTFLQKTEADVSVTPLRNTTQIPGSVVGADLTVRYKFSDAFSAGIGLNPTFLDYGGGEINYVPFYLSFRYSMLSDEKVSPYFLLNIGGSFLQLEPDPEFQGRLAIGASYNVSQRCALFVECGLAYMYDGFLWTPISLGIRL